MVVRFRWSSCKRNSTLVKITLSSLRSLSRYRNLGSRVPLIKHLNTLWIVRACLTEINWERVKFRTFRIKHKEKKHWGIIKKNLNKIMRPYKMRWEKITSLEIYNITPLKRILTGGGRATGSMQSNYLWETSQLI